mgnify:CR=1 FL=1
MSEEDVSWLARLRVGLSLSSSRLGGGILSIVSARQLDAKTLEEIEELLISADLGVQTAARLSDHLGKTRFGRGNPDEVREFLSEAITSILDPVAQSFEIEPSHKPHVVLFCGVNGSGKTLSLIHI